MTPALGTAHEHQWVTTYVDFDSEVPSAELQCPCGAITFAAAR